MKKIILAAVAALALCAPVARAYTRTNASGQVITIQTLEEDAALTFYSNRVDYSQPALFPNRQGFFMRNYDTKLDGTITSTTVVFNAGWEQIPSNAIVYRAIVDVILPQTPGTNSIAIGFGGGSDLWSANITNFVDTAIRIANPSGLQLTNDLDLTMTVVGSITQANFNVYGWYILGQ